MAVDVTLSMSEVSTSVSGNSSNVRIIIKSKQSAGSYNNNPQWSTIVIATPAGYREELGFQYTLPENREVTIWDHTYTVPHANDGTATLYVSAEVPTTPTYGTKSLSDSLVLTTIPRVSSILVKDGSYDYSTRTMGENAWVIIKPASPDFRHILDVTLEGTSYKKRLYNKTDTIQYWNSTNWVDLGTLNPSELCPYMSNTATGTLVYTLYTYTSANGSYIGSSSVKVKLTIPNNATYKPSIMSSNITITDKSTLPKIQNQSIYSYYGKYLKNKSNIEVSVKDYMAKYNATIKQILIEVNGARTIGTKYSFIPKEAKTYTIKVRATDSRGFFAEASKTITVNDYYSPIITKFDYRRVNQDGTPNDSGEYLQFSYGFDINFVGSKSTSLSGDESHPYVKLWHKKNGESWVLDYEITKINSASACKKDNQVYTVTNKIDTDSTYSVWMDVYDPITGVTYRHGSLSTAFTLLDFFHDGTGIAVGKVAEKSRTFDCGIPAVFKSIRTSEGANLDLVKIKVDEIGEDLGTVKTKVDGSLKSTHIAHVTGTSSAFPSIDISSVPAGTMMRIEVGIPIDNATTQTIAWFSTTVKKPDTTFTGYYLYNVGGYYYSANYNASIFINVSKSAVTINDAWTKVIGGSNAAAVNNLKSKSTIYVYTENL